MKDDRGRKWKKKDYLVAVTCIVFILIIILTPATIWIGSVLAVEQLGFDWEKYAFVSIITIICLWFVGMVAYQIKCDKRHNKFLKEVGLR
tara:strand:- start:9784 stop:10053 length:270 start_codon:yes stop_codon:yes gene_type:complete